MKREINLYINGQRADLDNNALVQMNYTAEDLTNPTIVKNSYSQAVTLKGTANNNRIFGHLGLLNRKTTSGGFNAMAKTPFEITNAMGEIIEKGYIKLSSVERKGADLTYKVNLFGGLGEFFYNLSYDEEGDKKTLASLDYGHDLDFTITTSTIQSAWATLASGGGGKWSVINFAPAYNGKPSNLSADKGIIRPALAGLETSVTVDGKTYGTQNGWSLVELGQDYNEWQTKDLRSYMQRPVVSVQKIIEACCSPTNNGGYTVFLDPDFFNEENPYYSGVWMSLPILNTLELKQSAGKATLTTDPDNFGASNESAEFVPSVILQGATATLTIKVKPCVLCSKKNASVSLSGYLRCNVRAMSVGMDAVTSEVRSFASNSNDPSATATAIGYFRTDAHGVGEWVGNELTFTMANVPNISYLFLDFYATVEDLVDDDGNRVSVSGYSFRSDGSEADYSSFINARSGTRITKDVLLATEGTPADYLVGYCKMFGLQLFYDKSINRVSILTRNSLYNGLHIDIEDRIDYANLKITPFVFQNKWYDLNVEYEDGEFAEYYEGIYGRAYGLQRVNTGYSFDATSKKLLDVVYKGAVEVSERSKYMLSIKRGELNIPAVMLDVGHTYNLYSADGESTSLDLPTARNTDTLTYFNDVFKGYDFESKPQFHGEDDKELDGANALLFFRGLIECPAGFQLSDDSAVMGQLNDGEPCWMLNGGVAISEMPSFGRYLFGSSSFSNDFSNDFVKDGSSTMYASLDMGTPYEIDIPDAKHPEGVTIYDKGWARYLADRYDVDTKVVSCKVDFRGITIGAELLRNFYYFDGCVWVLNSIKNYNVAEVSPMVECEFIKVKNRNNYTEGQVWQQ